MGYSTGYVLMIWRGFIQVYPRKSSSTKKYFLEENTATRNRSSKKKEKSFCR